MENKNLTEAQSLELITSMIQDSRTRLARNSGTPFLIWGYTTIAVSLFNALTLYLGWSGSWGWSWFAIPVVGWVGMMLLGKTEPSARNYIDRVISIIWCVLSIAYLWIFIGSTIYRAPILYYTILLMGVGTLITGLVIRHKTTQYCGIGAMICSLAYPLFTFLVLKCDIQTINMLKSWAWVEIAYFAAIFFVMMVIPGHILNRKYNRK